MSLTKAILENSDKHIRVECMFNPNEYTIAKSNSWTPQKATGKDVPLLTFTGGQSRTLNLELFIDGFEDTSIKVRDEVEKLWKLARVDKSLKNRTTGQGRPPLVSFQWGGNWHFKAAITSLSVKYTLFSDTGMPLRATATISMTEAEDEQEQKGQNPTSHSEPGFKKRVLQPSDSLPLIAYQEYGSSTLWRRIAEANDIDDPLSIRPGQVIAIPPR